MNKIIVFGGSGFIGSSLNKALVKAFPDIPIVSHDSKSCNLLDLESVRSGVKEVDGDTAIVLLAAIKRQRGDTAQSLVDNTSMICNLLTALDARAPDRLIFISSTAVYGEDVHNTAIGIDTPPSPTSYYGIAKTSCELALQKHFAESGNIGRLCILRPPTIFGVGEKCAGYGPARFARSAARGETITLWGDGSELREFVFVADLNKIVCNVLISSFSGLANVVSGKSVSFEDVLREIEEVAGRALTRESRGRSKNKVDHCFRVESNPAFMKQCSFTPLRQALQIVYDSEVEYGL